MLGNSLAYLRALNLKGLRVHFDLKNVKGWKTDGKQRNQRQ
jgi:hypothetical protein